MRIRTTTGRGASPLSGRYHNSVAPITENTSIRVGGGR
jgi:hypothetical protein